MITRLIFRNLGLKVTLVLVILELCNVINIGWYVLLPYILEWMVALVLVIYLSITKKDPKEFINKIYSFGFRRRKDNRWKKD